MSFIAVRVDVVTSEPLSGWIGPRARMTRPAPAIHHGFGSFMVLKTLSPDVQKEEREEERSERHVQRQESCMVTNRCCMVTNRCWRIFAVGKKQNQGEARIQSIVLLCNF